jgi:hypothetical protein
MKTIAFTLFILLLRIAATNLTTKENIVIAFYNLENLYDTIDNPMVNDDEFLPNGAKRYSGDIYRDKLFKLATVLNNIGKTHSRKGASIIGVAEIENDTVLYDLTRHFLLYQYNWRFIHYDSKDARGVDVALFYNPKDFMPQFAKTIEVLLPGKSKESATTRDILYVKGQLKEEWIHVLVNHWPSRRGGEERSAPARASAAASCKKTIDSIQAIDPHAKIILMGDLNDNPTDKSIRKTLNAVGTVKGIYHNQLYNPWESFYENGMGTLANRDVWGLFDQILLSASFLDSSRWGLQFKNAHIYSKPFMTEPEGKFKGYPMRTWEGNTYRGGFSDHFPTYVVLKIL